MNTLPNFICPCCGHRQGWSLELGELIFEEVIGYYGYSKRRFYHHFRCLNSLRIPIISITMYLMRKMMVAEMKQLSEFFFYSSECAPGAMYRKLERRLETDEPLSLQVQEIILRINLRLLQQKQKTA